MQQSSKFDDFKRIVSGYENEINKHAPLVAVVNQIARQLTGEEHPNTDDIVAKQNHVNARYVPDWSKVSRCVNKLGAKGFFQLKWPITKSYRFEIFCVKCKRNQLFVRAHLWTCCHSHDGKLDTSRVLVQHQHPSTPTVLGLINYSYVFHSCPWRLYTETCWRKIILVVARRLLWEPWVKSPAWIW